MILIKGAEAVIKNMNKFIVDFDKKVTVPAVRKGLRPLREEVKKNTKSNDLKKLVASKAYINKEKKVMGKVFFARSKNRKITLEKREVGFEVVANILEFGSVKRNIKPGMVVRTAREQTRGQVKSEIEKEARKRMAAL